MRNYKASWKTKSPKTRAAFPWPKKAKHIKAPLFNSDIYLVTDYDTYDQIVAAIKGKMPTKKQPTFAGISCRLKHHETGICIFVLGVFDNQISTLVHELDHITFMILHHVGVNIEEKGNNEVFCYLNEALYQQFIKIYKGK